MPTEDRIALRNSDPATAGATIVRARYDQVRAAILDVLGRDGSLTHARLAEAVEQKLGDGFAGSVRWRITAVKLDLEARGELQRTAVRGRGSVTVATPTPVSEERR